MRGYAYLRSAGTLCSRAVAPMVGVAALLSVAACDFKVTNPGPVQDMFLDDEDAHPAMVTGAARSLAEALNQTAFTTGAVTREIFPAGSTGSFGISPRQQTGLLEYDDEHVSWTPHQRARWQAEAAFARFGERVEDIQSYEPAARAALWAGYANRLLGENWCEAAIDGGELQPGRVWFERAEEWFSQAIQIGQNVGNAEVVTAAYAGRASVRVHLDNWAGAVADAQQVPDGFVFVAAYNDIDQSQYNRIFWAGANQPYRAHTVWNTKYEAYFLETGDPRTPWGEDPEVPVGDAAVLDLGNVPWYFQLKHPEKGSDINLSSGREMRLIEAETLLRDDSWQAAVDIINDLRTSVGVEPVSAGSLEEAWTALKRERGIELWLEGRRMGDLRRWEAEGTPGELHPLEVPGEQSHLSPNQTLCYDIPKSERESNPNIPLFPGG